MELLVLLLLTPSILANTYQKSNDPNDEPFLPIYPIYPYNPKLVKRAIEKKVVPHLALELYAPKVDAKDSYTASYMNNYQREPYYPNYNSHPKTSSLQPYSSYYNGAPYTYSTGPYAVYNSYSNPYPMNTPPYIPVPYYYYQTPHYYPNYYNQPVFIPQPPPAAPVSVGYAKDADMETEMGGQQGKDKKYSRNEKLKEHESNADQDPMGNQYMEGGNYISENLKDLDGQSTSYKLNSLYNQFEELPIPLSRPRIINMEVPEYPINNPYVKAQQLEQIMSQALVKLLAQNQQLTYSPFDTNQSPLIKGVDGSFSGQSYNDDVQPYTIPSGITGGRSYVVNPNTPILQTPAPPLKAMKYANDYLQKPLTRMVLEETLESYKGKNQKNDYDGYENSSAQVGQNYNPFGQMAGKQEQSYGNDQRQTYQSLNSVTVQTPQASGYQYNGYNPSQTSTQQHTEQRKTSLEDVNFGIKQTNKG